MLWPSLTSGLRWALVRLSRSCCRSGRGASFHQGDSSWVAGTGRRRPSTYGVAVSYETRPGRGVIQGLVVYAEPEQAWRRRGTGRTFTGRVIEDADGPEARPAESDGGA